MTGEIVNMRIVFEDNGNSEEDRNKKVRKIVYGVNGIIAVTDRESFMTITGYGSDIRRVKENLKEEFKTVEINMY